MQRVKHPRFIAIALTAIAVLLFVVAVSGPRVAGNATFVSGGMGVFCSTLLQTAGRVWSKNDMSAGKVMAEVAFNGAVVLAFGLILSGAITAFGAEHTVKKGIFAAGSCIVAGVLLFLFRLRQRILYGLSEIGVGGYLAYSKGIAAPETLSAFANDPTFLAAILTASVYLIVRGCDNVHVGLKERKAKLQIAAANSEARTA